MCMIFNNGLILQWLKETTGGNLLFPLCFSKWFLYALGYSWYDNWITTIIPMENNPLGGVVTIGQLSYLPLNIIFIGI